MANHQRSKLRTLMIRESVEAFDCDRLDKLDIAQNYYAPDKIIHSYVLNLGMYAT